MQQIIPCINNSQYIITITTIHIQPDELNETGPDGSRAKMNRLGAPVLDDFWLVFDTYNSQIM